MVIEISIKHDAIATIKIQKMKKNTLKTQQYSIIDANEYPTGFSISNGNPKFQNQFEIYREKQTNKKLLIF